MSKPTGGKPGDFDDIPAQALAWQRSGQEVALAFVMETWGSAPRRVGSLMAISARGGICGSVSGGCIEGDVVLEAQEAMEKCAPRVLEYGVSDDDAIGYGLACGGRIRVLVMPVCDGGLTLDMLEQMVSLRRQRQALAYVVHPGEAPGRLIVPADAPVQPALARRFAQDRSGMEGEEFIAVMNPPQRLAVIGAVHIAQALVPMAQLAGFDVMVIDPREAFASKARFPDVALSLDWPDEALRDWAPDARSAVVTLTHDPKLDDPALRMALETEAFYIGCLGSTRTHARRLERLQAAGLGAQSLARLHAPVGLDIGAATPAEIAVSVLAQMIGRLRMEDGA